MYKNVPPDINSNIPDAKYSPWGSPLLSNKRLLNEKAKIATRGAIAETT